VKHLGEELGALAMLIAGFTLWGAAFVIIYGVQAAGCHLGWHRIDLLGPATVQRTILLALLLAFIAVHVVLIWIARRWRPAAASGDVVISSFMNSVVVRLTVAASLTSLFCFWGIVWLTTC
jgi:hypothetical protein